MLWSLTTGTGAIKNSPAVSTTSGNVFFGTAGPNGAFYSVTVSSGTVNGIFTGFGNTSSFSSSSAAIDLFGHILVGSIDGTFFDFI